jgi:hypothetical protein
MRNIKVTNVVKESTNRLREIKNIQTMDVNYHINKIIENTFATLQKVFDNKQWEKNNSFASEPRGSRIIFPQYSKQYNRKGETRFSEQELRFIFVEEFNKYCGNSEGPNWFYSVETPTVEKYDFSDEKNPTKVDKVVDVKSKKQKGQSAMVDLSIHDEHLNALLLSNLRLLIQICHVLRKTLLN